VAVDDELPVSPVGGAPGYAFGKLLRDRAGDLAVPFFRAIDVVSDNRLPAGKTATTRHVFDATAAAGGPVRVTVVLLYRKTPWPLAHERGWTAVDQVRLVRTVTTP
jgi:hypothetical protein